MAILIIFSFLAGIVTVLSPCVIPILPALLSAGAGQGRSRPWGIILGLILSFSFFTLFLSAIIHIIHIPADFLRYIAIILIALFGLIMIFPSLGDWFAQATSGLANFGQSIQEKSTKVQSGFWSGFILGIALGIVWTPCAGPILAAITTLVATSAVTWQAVVLTLTYSLGAAIPMFLIIYGGNRGLSSSKFLSRHAEAIRKVFGFLMILTAIAIALHADVMFQQIAIKYFPLLTIEDNPQVQQELAKLKPAEQAAFAKQLQEGVQAKQKGQTLPKIAPAPDLVGITDWVNSKPLTLEQLRGKVVLIDFWTYSCINCIRTFPYLTRWYDTYKDKGLVIIGVHTPEFAFEKKLDNVEEATKRFNIHYPVALDNDYKTWQNYSNSYWPAHYLIDQQGIIRDFHFGEGAYTETENAIRNLLGLAPIEGEKEKVSLRSITAETYLGLARGASSYQPGTQLKPHEVASYNYQLPLQNDHVGLKGKWLVEEERIVSKGQNSELALNFLATRVYLVMDAMTSQTVTVLLDGAPLPKKYYTSDMNDKGEIMVKEPRKYDVVNLKGDYGRHTLTLIVPEGVSAYAFTFGDEP